MCAYTWFYMCIQYSQLQLHKNTHRHIYIYTCVYICMRIPTYQHSYIYTYIHTHMHADSHTYMHACMHTYIHACMHACMHAGYMHTCLGEYIVYMHTRMHTYVHTCIHTYTNIRTCRHDTDLFIHVVWYPSKSQGFGKLHKNALHTEHNLSRWREHSYLKRLKNSQLCV